MTLDDVGDALRGGGAAAVGLDLLVNSGDLLLTVLWVVLGSIETWVPLLSTLVSLAGEVSWLPESAIRTAMTVGLVALATLYAIRLLSKIKNNATDN